MGAARDFDLATTTVQRRAHAAFYLDGAKVRRGHGARTSVCAAIASHAPLPTLL
jgi:hypothetical protein